MNRNDQDPKFKGSNQLLGSLYDGAPLVELTEENCSPGTCKFLNGEMSLEDAQQLDKLSGNKPQED